MSYSIFTARILRIVLFLLLPAAAQAQWTTNPTLNTEIRDMASYGATETKVVTAPNGNSFIVWSHSTATGYKLRLQLVDDQGYSLWGSDGLMLDSLLGSTLFRFDIAIDNEGNAIIADQDQRSGSARWPVVFKVDQAGTSLWGTNGGGIQLTDTAATATGGLSPVICITDSNNVLVAWTASGTKTYVSFQKISPAGNILWTQRILDPATTSPKKYERPQMVISSGETFIMQYVSRTGSGLGVSTMFAQKYDGGGTAVWPAPTQVSTKTIGFAYFPAPVSDGYGGIFLSFTGANPSSAAISAVWTQRVYSDGHTWNATGNIAYATATEHSFDAGAAYVASQHKYFSGLRVTSNSQGAAGIYLQRIDTSGAVELTGNGQVVVPLSSGAAADIVYAAGMTPVNNGLMFVYYRGSSPATVFVRAKKVDFSGISAWTPDTTTVSDAPGNKLKFSVGRFVHNQVVVAWTDARTSNGGVYAQNIRNDGQIGPYPCAGITLSPAAMPADTVGSTGYNVAITQTGGLGTVTYAVASGTLPPGYTLSPSGQFSGGSTVPGTWTFTVKATDTNYCSVSQTYTLVVSCPVVALAQLADTCLQASAFPLTGGTPAGGTYSGAGVSNGFFDPQATGVGTFTIQYRYTVGACADSVTSTIKVVNCPTGVPATVATQGGFRMFPNPSGRRAVTIICDAPSTQLSVFSADGRLMLQDAPPAGSRNYQKTLDLTGWPAGIYQVVLRTGKGCTIQKLAVE